MRSGKPLFSTILLGPLVSGLVVLSSSLSIAQTAPTGEEAAEFRLNPNSIDQYRTSFGIADLRQTAQQDLRSGGRRKVRVAILDKGFLGWNERIGETLPKRTRHIPGPLKNDETTAHGSLMAEIVTSMVLGSERESKITDPLPMELLLYNVAGFSNFKAAIDDLIKRKVDLVLYSEVWELGGNYDGAGFINKEVNRATDAGVIWINAAGNFGGRTYNSPIVVGDRKLVDLPDERSSLELTCDPPNGEDVCPVKVTLTWNDFKNDASKGTIKDLDLALFDEDFKKVQVSMLKQVDIKGEAGPKESKYPREAITAELKKGTYYLWARARSQNWQESDRMRILVDGDFVTLNHGDKEESLQNPADNASVITVGASDTDRSSASKVLSKPELMAPSNVMEYYGRQFRGSSNSAALVMGKAVLLKYMNPEMNRQDMIQALMGENGGGQNGMSSFNNGYNGDESAYAGEPRYDQSGYSQDYAR